MNSIKSLLWLLPIVLGLCACNKSDEEGIIEEADIQLTTGDAQDLSLTSATLIGTVSPSVKNITEFGIAYCLENGNIGETYVRATDIVTNSYNKTFYVSISGLIPDATYTYRAYIKNIDGTIINANEVKTFHTDSPVVLLKSNTMQWVTTKEATLSWNLSDSTFYNDLINNKFQASFGVAWSIDMSALTPTGNRFYADTQAVVFNQGTTASVKLVSLKPSTIYYYTTYMSLNGKLYVATPSIFTTLSGTEITGKAPDGVQAVDMGLPSGIKWANMNVGAEKSTDTGLFFAWGETVGYNADGSDDHIFGWSFYKWCNGSRASQKKYCTNSEYGTLDNKTVLDLTDDAAFVNWGGEWRMPTYEEMKELVDNTTSEWTTLNGVNGYTLTSNLTGNFIFLPAAGCRVSESNYENGTDCYFWSSSVDQLKPYASQYFRFYVGKLFLASLFRYYGMNVRPIKR